MVPKRIFAVVAVTFVVVAVVVVVVVYWKCLVSISFVVIVERRKGREETLSTKFLQPFSGRKRIL